MEVSGQWLEPKPILNSSAPPLVLANGVRFTDAGTLSRMEKLIGPILFVVTVVLSAADATAQPPAPIVSPTSEAASPYQPPEATISTEGSNAAPAPFITPVTAVPPPYSPPNHNPSPQSYPNPPLPQPGQTPPGFHTHDGFFMRLMYGVGFLKVTSTSSNYDLQASGAAFGDMVSFGLGVRENVVLSLDTTVFMGRPTVRGRMRATDANDAFFVFMQMGPGLTYYLMPHNLFASVGLGLGNISISERREGQADVEHEMDMGWGATLAGGKEWWTSDNWGLGVAGRFVIVQSREKATDCLFRASSFSVAFTATYN